MILNLIYFINYNLYQKIYFQYYEEIYINYYHKFILIHSLFNFIYLKINKYHLLFIKFII